MKKIVCMIIICFVSACLLGVLAYANWEDMPTVYVTIAQGEHKLTYERMRIIDLDKDGKGSIHDLIYTVHEELLSDPASSHFEIVETEYGKTITELWDIDNGTGFGYYVNNVMGTSLDQILSENDHVYLFAYTDTVGWSDTYCFFDTNTAEVRGKELLTLTLSASVYDENWNPVVVPVANATITVDSKPTEYKTDENGRVTFPVKGSGQVSVSAISEDMTLVPPICLVKTNSSYLALGFLIIAITLVVAGVAFAAWFFIGKRNKHV